jgi:hypothetical protein
VPSVLKMKNLDLTLALEPAAGDQLGCTERPHKILFEPFAEFWLDRSKLFYAQRGNRARGEFILCSGVQSKWVGEGDRP